MASLRAGTQVNNRAAIREPSQRAVTRVASPPEVTPAVSQEVAILVRLPLVPELQPADTPEDSHRYESVNFISKEQSRRV